MKKFWKFSKSKNRKFLKFVFGQKNCFPVPLRPNYIDLHNFKPKTEKKILNFLDIEFFSKSLKNFVSNFCGARPHKMLTLMNKSPMYFLVLSLEVLWETGWIKKQLNCKRSSPNSVPGGHCQITSKCTKWIETVILWNKLSWKRLIQHQLLPWGHACPLGGRAIYHSKIMRDRGRGPVD